jgi:hypothetical protein
MKNVWLFKGLFLHNDEKYIHIEEVFSTRKLAEDFKKQYDDTLKDHKKEWSTIELKEVV